MITTKSWSSPSLDKHTDTCFFLIIEKEIYKLLFFYQQYLAHDVFKMKMFQTTPQILEKPDSDVDRSFSGSFHFGNFYFSEAQALTEIESSQSKVSHTHTSD